LTKKRIIPIEETGTTIELKQTQAALVFGPDGEDGTFRLELYFPPPSEEAASNASIYAGALAKLSQDREFVTDIIQWAEMEMAMMNAMSNSDLVA
jgi:hypothetical protein